MQGRGSGAVRAFAPMAESTGEIDEYGLPVAQLGVQYRGRAMVVYGHTPTPIAEWINNTICIDTGCVFGGKLTGAALSRRELVEVPAAGSTWSQFARWSRSRRKRQQAATRARYRGRAGQAHAGDAAHRIGARGPENAACGAEIMSRFALDPRWLIYLPPTMSPPETSARPGLLEHPDEAFGYFARAGVTKVMIEEKHMGSRAVIVLACDAEAARRRFGVEDGKAGVIYTRTGRSFFADDALEAAVVARIGQAARKIGFWDRLEPTAVPRTGQCLVKARGLIAPIVLWATGMAGPVQHCHLLGSRPVVSTSRIWSLASRHVQRMPAAMTPRGAASPACGDRRSARGPFI